MAPSLTIIGVFIAFPIVQSFWFSLHDWRIGAAVQEWVGLDNYLELFADEHFWNALRVTAIFAGPVSVRPSEASPTSASVSGKRKARRRMPSRSTTARSTGASVPASVFAGTHTAPATSERAAQLAT